jgi:hypothetical protein
MKYLLILLLFYSFVGVSQTQYTIYSSGSDLDRYNPVGAYWGYHRSAYIYTSTELTSAGGTFGDVTHLSWEVATARSTSMPLKIYMKTTSSTDVSSATWSSTISGATTVYNSSQTFSSTGWHQIDITDFLKHFLSYQCKLCLNDNFKMINSY